MINHTFWGSSILGNPHSVRAWEPKFHGLSQLWPWLVITGYFYGIVHSINGVLLVLTV